MHCFEGHHVTTLGELNNKDGSRTDIGQLESINLLIQDGKTKATDIRTNLKNLEATSGTLKGQFNKANLEINETFNFYTSLLEERKNELLRELEGLYSARQLSLSNYSQKAQDTVDKIYQVNKSIIYCCLLLLHCIK